MTATPEVSSVITACEALVDDLKSGRLAYGSVLTLQNVLRPIETAELARWCQKQADEIQAASGAALAHTWYVTERGEIKCRECPTDTGQVLRIGAVPECDPTMTCAPYARRHLVLGHNRDSGRCIYCDTVFPATAGVECVGGAR